MKTPTYRRHVMRQLRAHLIRTRPPYCHICGEWIDMQLSGRHPRGPTIDHLIPRAVAPELELDPNNVALAHLLCNQRRGASTTSTRKSSRVW
jgi:5-methylcytosine-specific restriction endonuclease McrA